MVSGVLRNHDPRVSGAEITSDKVKRRVVKHTGIYNMWAIFVDIRSGIYFIKTRHIKYKRIAQACRACLDC